MWERTLTSRARARRCESCLDRLFSLGPEPCPVCGQTIRKNQFQPQIFQNLEVQKEVAVRKRTAKMCVAMPFVRVRADARGDLLAQGGDKG